MMLQLISNPICRPPRVFRANDAPRYLKAFIVHIVIYGIQIVTILLLRLRLMRLNVQKRKAQRVAVEEAALKASGEATVCLAGFLL
jgi:hypothetical protein